jgi:hypothetical protein
VGPHATSLPVAPLLPDHSERRQFGSRSSRPATVEAAQDRLRLIPRTGHVAVVRVACARAGRLQRPEYRQPGYSFHSRGGIAQTRPTTSEPLGRRAAWRVRTSGEPRQRHPMRSDRRSQAPKLRTVSDASPRKNPDAKIMPITAAERSTAGDRPYLGNHELSASRSYGTSPCAICLTAVKTSCLSSKNEADYHFSSLLI